METLKKASYIVSCLILTVAAHILFDLPLNVPHILLDMMNFITGIIATVMMLKIFEQRRKIEGIAKVYILGLLCTALCSVAKNRLNLPIVFGTYGEIMSFVCFASGALCALIALVTLKIVVE